jgi:hypothetical protein
MLMFLILLSTIEMAKSKYARREKTKKGAGEAGFASSDAFFSRKACCYKFLTSPIPLIFPIFSTIFARFSAVM